MVGISFCFSDLLSPLRSHVSPSVGFTPIFMLAKQKSCVQVIGHCQRLWSILYLFTRVSVTWVYYSCVSVYACKQHKSLNSFVGQICDAFRESMFTMYHIISCTNGWARKGFSTVFPKRNANTKCNIMNWNGIPIKQKRTSNISYFFSVFLFFAFCLSDTFSVYLPM